MLLRYSAKKDGAKIQGLNVKSAEFNVNMASGASDMYIAIIKVCLFDIY